MRGSGDANLGPGGAEAKRDNYIPNYRFTPDPVPNLKQIFRLHSIRTHKKREKTNMELDDYQVFRLFLVKINFNEQRRNF